MQLLSRIKLDGIIWTCSTFTYIESPHEQSSWYAWPPWFPESCPCPADQGLGCDHWTGSDSRWILPGEGPLSRGRERKTHGRVAEKHLMMNKSQAHWWHRLNSIQNSAWRVVTKYLRGGSEFWTQDLVSILAIVLFIRGDGFNKFHPFLLVPRC